MDARVVLYNGCKTVVVVVIRRWLNSHLDEFVGQVASLKDADETRDVIVAVFLVAYCIQHDESNGVDVTHFAVGKQAPHFLQTQIGIPVKSFIRLTRKLY